MDHHFSYHTITVKAKMAIEIILIITFMNIKANISFRPAEKEDLIRDKKTLRFGQAYLVMNSDGKTLSGFHIVRPDTNPLELSSWFKQGRVYVPLCSLDSKIEINAEHVPDNN